MTDRVVTSPAGERITVFDDDDFIELLDQPTPISARIAMQWNRNRAAVMAALWNEGTVASPEGRASTVLATRAAAYGMVRPVSKTNNGATNILTGSAMLLCVERKHVAARRRTFEIRLVALPELWYRKLVAAHLDAPAPPPAVEEAPEPPAPEPPTGVEHESDVNPPTPSLVLAPVVTNGHEPSPVEIELSSAVATALLTTVVEIISTGNGSGAELGRLRVDVEGLQERLADQIAYADKLRRELRDTGDVLAAVKQERDGLRQRLRSAEYNLKIATGADAQRIIDAEVHRQLDRIMRAKPDGANAKVAAG